MADDELWEVPPANLMLKSNEVHVWRVSLKMLPGNFEHLKRILADEEQERASRFHFEKDRRRWVVIHALLRMLLGRYLDIDPGKLRFMTNGYGKPYLVYPPSGTRLHFNLSHAGELALFAFSYDRQVGIDVEYIHTEIDYRKLATYHFSARERAVLSELPVTLQREAFFLCWSRKEAYVKARGKGLSTPLDQFDVSLVPGEPAALLDSREEPGVNERWVLRALTPGVDYAGALVVEGSGWQLCCWQL